MNLTVQPVTRLAVAPPRSTSKGDGQGACPSRPAGYCGRYAHRQSSMNPRTAVGRVLQLLLAAVCMSPITLADTPVTVQTEKAVLIRFDGSTLACDTEPCSGFVVGSLSAKAPRFILIRLHLSTPDRR